MNPQSTLAAFEGGPDIYTTGWLWLLVLVGLVGTIAWFARHLGRGGPWAR